MSDLSDSLFRVVALSIVNLRVRLADMDLTDIANEEGFTQ